MRVILAILTLITCILTSTEARAEKTSDILYIYGNDVVDDAAVKRQELDSAKDYYEELEAEVAYLNSLNAGIENIDVESINKAAASMAEDIYALQDKLMSDVDMTVDEIFQTENELAQLRTRYDLTAEAGRYYSTLYTYNPPMDKVTEALNALNEKEIEYSNAVKYGEIGEVSNVHVPIRGSYRIASYFGWRIDPLGSGKDDFHRGMDFASNTGNVVEALFSGTVIVSEYHWGMGNYVRIDHGNGIITTYMHLSELSVNVGDKVEQYDEIGKLGGTGAWSTGPHLHLAVFIDGVAVDPAKLFM